MQGKQCPQCQNISPLVAQVCQACGHIFSSSVAPSQTQSVYIPPQTSYAQPPNPHTYGGPAAGPAGNKTIWMPAGSHSVVAVVLVSIFIGGWVGCLVNRQYVKGIVTLVVAVALAFATCGISAIITWPLSVIDAILISLKLNRGEAVSEWECF